MSIVTGLVIGRESGEEPGSYKIKPSGASAPNYVIVFVNGTLTIEITVSLIDRSRATTPVSYSDKQLPERPLVIQNESPQYGAPIIAVRDNPVALSSGRAEFMVSTSGPSVLDLSIYDAVGNLLYRRTLETGSDGNSAIIDWDLKTLRGGRVSVGTYLLQVVARDKRSGQIGRARAKIGVTSY